MTFQSTSATQRLGCKRHKHTPHPRYITAPGSVWTIPLSLAATYGISIDFFSSGYSDVSVPTGSRSPKGTKKTPKDFPYEVAFGNPRINRCMLLPEAYRSLPRPSSSSKPSHPPYSVSVSDDYIIDERLRNLCTTVITSGTDACYVLQPAFFMPICMLFSY